MSENSAQLKVVSTSFAVLLSFRIAQFAPPKRSNSSKMIRVARPAIALALVALIACVQLAAANDHRQTVELVKTINDYLKTLTPSDQLDANVAQLGAHRDSWPAGSPQLERVLRKLEFLPESYNFEHLGYADILLEIGQMLNINWWSPPKEVAETRLVQMVRARIEQLGEERQVERIRQHYERETRDNFVALLEDVACSGQSEAARRSGDC